MKKLIFFDFDGVLVDTLGVAYHINTLVNDNLSVEEYVSFFEGNVLARPMRKDGTHKKYHPSFYDLYDEGTRELVVPEPIKMILQKLSEKYILTMVSSSHTNSISKILGRENISSFFKDILGADVHASKVEKIKMLLEKYKLTPEETIFITDTTGDIKEARECNVESVAVTWGYHNMSTLAKAEPRKLVSEPLELLKSIEELSI